MVFFDHSLNLLHRLGFDTLRNDLALDRTDQDILGRMRKVNKLQQLGLVAAPGQQIAADGIGGQRRKALLDDTVTGKQRKIIRFDLCIEFMLTAGHRKDHLRIPLDGVVQRIVGRGIAGMQC